MILQDKVALVTGASELVEQPRSHSVLRVQKLSSDIRSTEGEETADLIRETGAECLFVKSDVLSEADVRELVQKAIATYKPDCAFNNAGIDLLLNHCTNKRSRILTRSCRSMRGLSV